jgi:hypothetical protein
VSDGVQWLGMIAAVSLRLLLWVPEILPTPVDLPVRIRGWPGMIRRWR